MASRELKVEIIGDASSLERAFGRADKATGKLGGSSSKAGKALGFLKGGLIGVGAAAAGALAVGFKRGFDEMVEAQKVTAQTEAVLKSTGGQAGLTAKQVENLAGRLSAMSGVDDEAIQSGENLLLTFTNVRNEVGKGNDIFNQATGIMLDMSTALGQDMKSSAIQLGKALNDPIKGMTALQRVGVSFTAAQKETVKGLVESGQSMKAQKLILAELTKEFGGSAKAAGDTFPGQMNKLKNAFDEVAAKMVEKLLPYMTRFADFLLENMPTIERVAGDVFKKIGDAITLMSEAFKIVQPVIEQVLPVMVSFAKFLTDVMFAPLKIIVALLKGDWGAAWDAAKAPVEALGAVLGSLYTAVLAPLMGQFTELASWVGKKLGEVVGFFTALPGQIAGTLGNLASTALEPFKTAFTVAKTWVGNRIDDVVTFFVNLPGRIAATIAGLVSTAIEPFKNAFGSIKSFIGGVVNDVVGFFIALPGRIAGTIAALVSRGLQPFQAAFSTMAGIVTGLLDKIKDGIEWIGNKAGAVLNMAIAPFKAAGQAMADGLGPLISALETAIGLAQRLKDLWDSVVGLVSSNAIQEEIDRKTGRARGGPVSRGGMYIVGEQGPEMFVPKQSGSIMTASQTRRFLRGGGSGGLTKSGGPGQQGESVPAAPKWANESVWQAAVAIAGSMGKLEGFIDAVNSGSYRANAGLLNGIAQNRTRWNWNVLDGWPSVRDAIDMMLPLGQGMSGAEAAEFFGWMKQGGTLPGDGLYYGHKGETVIPLDRSMGQTVIINVTGYVGSERQLARELAPAFMEETRKRQGKGAPPITRVR